MSTKVNDVMSMVEAIGATAPIADEDGVLSQSVATAPNYNTKLRDRKPTIEINQDYIEKHKENAQKGKNIIDIAEKIGSQGLDDSVRYNEDLDANIHAKNKAYKALNEAIAVLGSDVIDYWCPDAETKQSAPKLRGILEKFVTRLK